MLFLNYKEPSLSVKQYSYHVRNNENFLTVCATFFLNQKRLVLSQEAFKLVTAKIWTVRE